MKKTLLIIFLMFQAFVSTQAQERVVEIDFESGSFVNNPNIPFDQAFGVVGEAGDDIEFVKLNIYFEAKSYIVHSYIWNRIKRNSSETFKIVVPPVLKSNTKYDFEVITYKSLTADQKSDLLESLKERVRFLFSNNIYFDGKRVVVNKPRDVYDQLNQLIKTSLQYYESKNLIPLQSPSSLVLDDLKKQSDFKFKRLFRKKSRNEINGAANKMVNEKLDHLVELVVSELKPFINSQIVQHYRLVNIKSVETDKEVFTLPVNMGFYAWNKTISINNTSVQNINFTPAIGLTMPFKNKSRLAAKTRMFDSFGFSTGVLLAPITDGNGNEYVTPAINLPIYTGFGFRLFKVVRLNGGVLILGEKGTQDFGKLSVIPTAGIALELNLWMGIKK